MIGCGIGMMRRHGDLPYRPRFGERLRVGAGSLLVEQHRWLTMRTHAVVNHRVPRVSDDLDPLVIEAEPLLPSSRKEEGIVVSPIIDYHSSKVVHCTAGYTIEELG